MKKDVILDFIHRRFEVDCNWTSGNCYYFALILKDKFDGDIYYDVTAGHFVTRIDDVFYDYNGVYSPKGESELVLWDYFERYDSLQKDRIIADCTL